MVVLINHRSSFFDQKVAQALFELNRELLDTPRSFEEMVTDWFFNVYERGQFIGCIFCYVEDGCNYVGGFANRKCHRQALAALNEIKRQFPVLCARTRHKTADFLLKKAGFKQQEPNIWKWETELNNY